MGWPQGSSPQEHVFTYVYIYFFFFLICWILVATQAFSSCGEQGLLFVVMHGPLTAAASPVAEHGP